MSGIVATSQQTRFDPASVNATEIDLRDVSISIGKTEVLQDARILLKSGTRYGLIGPNGSGKSTLLQAIVDKIIPGISESMDIHLVSQLEASEEKEGGETAMERVLRGHLQHANALEKKTLLSQAAEASEADAQALVGKVLLRRAEIDLERANKLAALRSGARGKAARTEQIQSEQAVDDLKLQIESLSITDVHVQAAQMLIDVMATLDLLGGDQLQAAARRILIGLGFSNAMIDGPFSSLSGGWRSRCRLATALLVPTDLLLLDEPSNFMDLQSIIWLEQHLASSTTFSILLLTSHDRVFLDRVAEQTITLRNHQLDYFDGNPSLMERTEKEERRAKEKVMAGMEKKREHIESSIRNGRKLAKATNDDSRMRAVKSREKKLENRWGLETSDKGTRFKLNRDLGGYHTTARKEMTLEREEREAAWRIEEPSEIQGSLMTLENVSVGYRSDKVVVKDVNMVIQPGARLALVGSNGQGKSTLAKAIIGQLGPLKGVRTTHPRLKIGYYSQHATEALSQIKDATALSYIMENLDIDEQQARKSLAALGLAGKVVSHTRIADLSGGQKVRLALVDMFFDRPNLVILDEVTTHLDAASIRAFARALREYKGAVVLITHDRWFSSVVVDEEVDDEVGDDEGEEDDAKPAGKTLFIRNGKCKEIAGMKEYERIMLRKIDKLAKG